MRLLLYEHLTALAGRDRGQTPSLVTEGQAMLAGLLRDCSSLPGIEPHTLVGPDSSVDLPATIHHVDPAKDWLACFCELIEHVDAVLIIAPEFERILETLTHRVEAANKPLIGSSTDAIAVTADKWTCGRVLEAQGIPTPPSVLLPAGLPVESTPRMPYPIVMKPRDGAGSLATILIPNADSWVRAEATVRRENPAAEWIVQPFASGLPASVACIVHERGILTLPAATQILSEEGRFHYRGGELPLSPSLSQRAQGLARRATAAIYGLRGYVGVDLILGAADDGRDDQVIEINPRITTSYLGLRELSRQNLLGLILAACHGEPLPQLAWNGGTVRFQADGSIVRDS